MIRKYLFRCILLLVVFFGGTCFLVLPVRAEETSQAVTMPSEYFSLLETLPKELFELLPDGLLSSDGEEVGAAVAEMSDFSYLLRTVLELVGLRLGDCLRILATVAGLLLLVSVVRAIQSSLRNAQLSRAFSFCSTLIVILVLSSAGYGCFAAVTEYFNNLLTLTRSAIPLLASLYVTGGNVTAAVTSTSGLSIFLTVMEEIVGRSILPFCGLCLALAMIGALDSGVRIHTLSGTLKKNYTTLLAFLMMLLVAMLASQTVLAAKGDTLTMKSAKFAISNMIPVVGGSISELLRTLSAGVGYLRGSVGICGILLLLLLLLPTLAELFLLRLTWQICASLADLLGCDTEKRLLEEFASVLGYLIAAVAICSAIPTFSFVLVMHCASALV